MFKDILNGGQTLRREAAAAIDAAVTRIDAIRIKGAESTQRASEKVNLSNAANERAHKLLPSNHDRLYQLAGLDGIISSTPSRSILPHTLEVKLDQLPSIPSFSASVGLGGGAGIVASAAVTLAATLSGPVLGLLLIPVLIGSLCGSLFHAKRMKKISAQYEGFADTMFVQLDVHVCSMEQIGYGADLNLRLTAYLEKQVQENRSKLQTVAADTTNAAILLRDVLNTPLLNEDGAFIQEVIDQLHEQGKRVEKLKERVEMAAE